MITAGQVIEWSKPHRVDGGRHTRITNGRVEASIVGGAKGLYGDFSEDFEVALIDVKTKKFLTKFFRPEVEDDVMGYVSVNEMETLLNSIFKPNDFQVL